MMKLIIIKHIFYYLVTYCLVQMKLLQLFIISFYKDHDIMA